MAHRPVPPSEEHSSVRRQLDDILGERTAREIALVARLVTGFRGKAGALVALFEAALAEGDTDAAARHLHTLKGAAAVLGARQLPQLCEGLEPPSGQDQLAIQLGIAGRCERLAEAVECFAAVLQAEWALTDPGQPGGFARSGDAARRT